MRSLVTGLMRDGRLWLDEAVAVTEINAAAADLIELFGTEFARLAKSNLHNNHPLHGALIYTPQ